MIRDTKMWAVIEPGRGGGSIIARTVRRTKGESIAAMFKPGLSKDDLRMEWFERKIFGYRAVRVIVKVAP